MATKWLTVEQVARRLGVSQSTVWRLVRRGALVSTKTRGRRVVAATSVHEMTREVTVGPAAAQIRPLSLEDALFRLAGKFRSSGRGPGSSDKHHYLGSRS
jgi:excisionase family DNA binding protein